MEGEHWHLEVTGLTGRLFLPPASFEQHSPYVAVAQVELLGDGLAFIRGALRADGRQVSLTQWRQLGEMLRRLYGVREIQAERNGRRVAWQTGRLQPPIHPNPSP